MKERTTRTQSMIKCNEVYEAESIEEKLRRLAVSGEPVKETVGMIYTRRRDGVLPQYDIRTDRFEVIQNGMDTMTRSAIANRDNNPSTTNINTNNDTPKE